MSKQIDDSLQAVYDRHGMLTPGLLLEEARDPSHPLHSRFEWDDTEAAERWRLYQARKLIQLGRTVYRAEKGNQPARDVRSWQAIPDPDHGAVFEPVEKVARDELLTAMVLRDMERDWKLLKARYGHFAEFARMVREDTEQVA